MQKPMFTDTIISDKKVDSHSLSIDVQEVLSILMIDKTDNMYDKIDDKNIVDKWGGTLCTQDPIFTV